MSKYDNTVQFLKIVAKRLSGRTDCKQITYTVSILSTAEGKQIITIKPQIYIFPNKYDRKPSNRNSILSYAAKKLNYSYTEVSSGRIVINTEELLSGVFEYRLSFDKRYRAWFKVE